MALPKPSNPNQTTILTGVLLLILGLSLAYFFLLPNLKEARVEEANLLAQSSGREADIQALKSAQASLNAAKAVLEQKRVNFDNIASHLPPTEEIPQLYLQMEGLITKLTDQGLKEITYNVGLPEEVEAGQIKVPITLAATGSYPNLKASLISLENALRPLTLSQITLAQASASTEGAAQSGQFTLNVTGYASASGLSAAYQPEIIVQ